MEAIDEPNGQEGVERAGEFTWESSAKELSRILEDMAGRPQKASPAQEPLP